MDPILISNSYIMESVQPETLEEPVSKSTILYANRFSGVDEVDITDEALLDILNSTIGTSGNNVLVQLKQKMQAYPDGPWYIDSNDGVVHIHNRKFTDKTSHVYTYMAEPGEILSASFKIVEVYKQNTAGLAGFVNAVTKTVSALMNPQVDNPPEAMFGERKFDPSVLLNQQNELATLENFGGPPLSMYRDTSYYSFELERRRQLKAGLDNLGASLNASNEEYNQWLAMTPAQRQSVLDSRNETALQTALNNGAVENIRATRVVQDENGQQREVFANPEYTVPLLKYDYYISLCQQYGSSSPQAQKAYREYLDSSKGIKVKVDKEEQWCNHTYTLTMWATHTSTTGYSPTTEQERQLAEKNLLDNWKSKRSPFNMKGDITVVSRGPWTMVSQTKYTGRTSTDRGDVYYQQKEKCVIKISAYTLEKVGVYFPLSRFMGEYVHSGSSSSNPLAAMQAAAANIGRGKKEKQLQAQIRIIGNPLIESTHQFIIQNVGKKFSGVWYVKSVSHIFEHGQGYVCDVTLSKQLGKSKVSGQSSTVNTRNYTSGSGGSGLSSTSKSGRPQANRVPSDNYTYQDALNEQWTAEERAYVINAVNSAPNQEEARRILEAESYNIADKNYYNRTQNASTTYVTVSTGTRGIPTATGTPKVEHGRVKRTSGTLPKQAMDVLRNYTPPK